MTSKRPWNIKEGVYEVKVIAPKTQTVEEMRKKGLETPSTQE